jgi:DNA-binding MarR family transcriptional regulator
VDPVTRAERAVADSTSEADGPLDDAVRSVEQAMTELFRLAASRRVHSERQRRSRTALSRTEWELLRRVDDLGPVRVSRLAELVDLSPAVTSRALGELEAQAMVARARTPEDGRGVSFRTTAKGRRTRARFQAAMMDELTEVLRDWPARDRAALARVFPRLVDDLRSSRH